MARISASARPARQPRFCVIATAFGLACFAPPALAEQGLLLSDGQPRGSESLAAGEQLVIETRSGPLRFGGRSLDLADFTGLLGYSSEVAYVVVIAGQVREGGRRVGPGRMLLIPPYGGAPIVQRYDARRLMESWSQSVRTARAEAFTRLAAIAQSQGRGVFFGRLARTNFNVAAPGNAERELAGRTVRGGGAVQAIRFSGTADPAAIERRVIDGFVAALLAGDAVAVAALMDPVPFGNTDLRGGAAEARLTMARALIAQRDWGALLREASVARAGEGNDWTVSGPGGRATLALRPMGDFVFVRTIEVGGL